MAKSNKINIESLDYIKKIKEETDHWNHYEKGLLDKGIIPWWVDLKNCNTSQIADLNINSSVEHILRGEEKQRVINIASEHGGKALDLGCGCGWLSLELARRGITVTGLDVSEHRINIANFFYNKNKEREKINQIRYIVQDLNFLNLDGSDYNVVVCWDSLHHILESERLISKIHQVLKSDGLFLVFDHIGNKFIKILGKLRSILSKRPEDVSPFEDITQKEMIDFIKAHFEIVELKYRFSIPFRLLHFIFLKVSILHFLLPHVLPAMVKVDKLLSSIIRGEYVFIVAKKVDSTVRSETVNNITSNHVY